MYIVAEDSYFWKRLLAARDALRSDADLKTSTNGVSALLLKADTRNSSLFRGVHPISYKEESTRSTDFELSRMES